MGGVESAAAAKDKIETTNFLRGCNTTSPPPPQAVTALTG